ncbi:uncharacterized protein YALI1_A08875g [Yarrowia lipolytica]|uniref:Uncharacterized protein n=1 Tax=Yarrowia lipolytica TaxID=4952 RepID=A0A1D8N492_YARLL|nr:hypothetical protein YALI1_A08875g [Yarrowia lipolytica]
MAVRPDKPTYRPDKSNATMRPSTTVTECSCHLRGNLHIYPVSIVERLSTLSASLGLHVHCLEVGDGVRGSSASFPFSSGALHDLVAMSLFSAGRGMIPPAHVT